MASTQTRKEESKPALKKFHVTHVKIQVHSVGGEPWSLEDISKATHAQGTSQSSLNYGLNPWCCHLTFGPNPPKRIFKAAI